MSYAVYRRGRIVYRSPLYLEPEAWGRKVIRHRGTYRVKVMFGPVKPPDACWLRIRVGSAKSRWPCTAFKFPCCGDPCP